MLAATRPDVVVICTPPHTHLPIARTPSPPARTCCWRSRRCCPRRARGADRGAHRRRPGCQVGFQALGSAALTAADRRASPAGWARSPASPRSPPGNGRTPTTPAPRGPGGGACDGRPVLDGALANPFAHAVMQCLAVAEALAGAPVRPVAIEVERYRVRPIEVEDTAVLRVVSPRRAADAGGGDPGRRGLRRGRGDRDRHRRAGRCWSTRPTGCGCPATSRHAGCRGGGGCWRTCSPTGPTRWACR